MSSSKDQQELVSVLYSVHDKLRVVKSQAKDEQDWQDAWKEHTSDFKTLQEYSKAMHDLATKVWEPRNTKTEDAQSIAEKQQSSGVKLKCRLEWVVNCCKDYFKEKFGKPDEGKLRLLDVGSCYNPFSKYSSYFEIVAVDLCPAPGFEDQIYQCDFLELCVDKNEISECPSLDLARLGSCAEKYRKVARLPKKYFEVVVFSYFLEYLADSRQRLECCRKAHDLLKIGGILFVLRPDSSKATPTGNNVLIKKMKVGMGLLGFRRIYFEKLEHLWCMAFKKMTEEDRLALIQSPYFKKDVQKVGVDFVFEDSSLSSIHELFAISQDFKQHEQLQSSTVSNFESLHCDQRLLEELPNIEDL